MTTSQWAKPDLEAAFPKLAPRLNCETIGQLAEVLTNLEERGAIRVEREPGTLRVHLIGVIGGGSVRVRRRPATRGSAAPAGTLLAEALAPA